MRVEMKVFINIVLFAVHIVSSVITLLILIFDLLESWRETADLEKMLKKNNFPLSYNQILCVGFISMALMFITAILIKKMLFGKL